MRRTSAVEVNTHAVSPESMAGGAGAGGDSWANAARGITTTTARHTHKPRYEITRRWLLIGDTPLRHSSPSPHDRRFDNFVVRHGRYAGIVHRRGQAFIASAGAIIPRRLTTVQRGV